VGYGEGEAWLRLRHQHRFSRSGVAWRGRIYSGLPFVRSLTERRLHSGVWGTAAFPAVYHTRAHTMQALPHRPEWLIGAVVLLLLGLTMLELGHLGMASGAVVVLGLAGVGITFAKCAVFGWRSNLDGLPEMRGYGPRFSRCVYRCTIGWLHVVQPFARSYGYVRGWLGPPKGRREEVSMTAPVPPPDASAPIPQRHPARLLFGARECHFWGETWTSGDALLTRVVERLRAVRLGRGVHVDDGWRSDRDISIGVGAWGWAHIRALVEDHGTGRCLFRARVQVRLRLGTVLLLALTLAVIVLAAMRGWHAPAVALAAGASILLTKIARDVSRDACQVLDAVAASADDFGMQRLAPAVPRRRADAASTWTSHLKGPEPTHGA
jgi:hypothetical protein